MRKADAYRVGLVCRHCGFRHTLYESCLGLLAAVVAVVDRVNPCGHVPTSGDMYEGGVVWCTTCERAQEAIG